MLKIKLSVTLFNKHETCELIDHDAAYILASLRKAPHTNARKRPFVCIAGYRGMSIHILEGSFENLPSDMIIRQGIAYQHSDKNICWPITNKNLETEQIAVFISKWHQSTTRTLQNRHLHQSTTLDTHNLLAAYSMSSACLTSQTRFLSAPAYEPEQWNNDINVLANNNCYTYALNIKGMRKSSGKDPNKTSFGNIVKNCLADGLHISTTVTDSCHTHLIALFASSPFADMAKTQTDYHFFRRDADGRWSHKNGHCNATNRDFSGNVIQDVMTCDRGRFRYFFCFFHVSTSTIQKVSERV